MACLKVEQIPEEFRTFLRPMIDRDILDQKILDVIASKTNTEGISEVSQSYIAEMVGTNQPQVCKHIRRLIKHGFLATKGRGAYEVLKRDAIHHGATSVILKYLQACINDNDILSLPLKEQGEKTGLTVPQVQMAQGYISSSKT